MLYVCVRVLACVCVHKYVLHNCFYMYICVVLLNRNYSHNYCDITSYNFYSGNNTQINPNKSLQS